jgi:hypothetical protein
MSNVADEFNAITEHFSPRVIAMANGQYFKLAKFKGEFPFHAHADEDESILVHRGDAMARALPDYGLLPEPESRESWFVCEARAEFDPADIAGAVAEVIATLER